jgi:hypothetical protein
MKIVNEKQSEKITLLKRQIIDTFYCWIKLRLPDKVFANLVSDCPHLFPLIFDELGSESAESVEVATKCIIELLKLSQNIEMYAPIKNYVAANVDKLISSAAAAILKKDIEKADLFS